VNLKTLFARFALPVVAIAFGLIALRLMATSRPDEGAIAAVSTPAAAPKDGTSVVGAGVVEPSSELIAVAPSVAGVIQRVDVVAGQQVRKGQVLFTLDDRDIAAEVQVRDAQITASQEQIKVSSVILDERATNLALYESIGDPRAMTQEELTRRRYATQNARAQLGLAQAQLQQGKAELARLRTQLSLRVIAAPLDATVLKVTARPGQFAPAGALSDPLVTLGQVQPLHVRVDVDEADIGRLSGATAARVSPRGQPGHVVQATLVRIEPLVVPKKSLTNAAAERVDTRVLQVVFALPAGAAGFFVGQQVDAFMPALLAATPAATPPAAR
jgi:HlyD family secretion protein